MLSLVLATAVASPAVALPADQVVEKLDTIIVFAPVDTSSPSSPKPLKFELNGKSRNVFFAAFSPSAVKQIINDRLIPQKLPNAKNIKFGAFSLSKFDSLIESKLDSKGNYRVIYVPDPLQMPFAEKLLIKQGNSPNDTRKLVKDMPVVFCPTPPIMATPNSGALKGETFIPCSTDYKSVKSFIDKGIETNKDLRKKSPSVVAIPLTNFASMLTKSSQADIGNIRVLPNPSNVKALQNLQQ